jgi:hypothetical protein
MRLLSHPFRLLPNGAAATVEEDSEAGDREGLVHIALTVRGERHMAPDFGINDPTFTGFDPGDVAACASVFGPAVEIVSAEVEWSGETEQVVVISFQ